MHGLERFELYIKYQILFTFKCPASSLDVLKLRLVCQIWPSTVSENKIVFEHRQSHWLIYHL